MQLFEHIPRLALWQRWKYDDDTRKGLQLRKNQSSWGGRNYQLIFHVVLDPDLVGFMDAVTKVLEAENISVLPCAAYSSWDDIFVQSNKDFEKAMLALDHSKKNEKFKHTRVSTAESHNPFKSIRGEDVENLDRSLMNSSMPRATLVLRTIRSYV